MERRKSETHILLILSWLRSLLELRRVYVGFTEAIERDLKVGKRSTPQNESLALLFPTNHFAIRKSPYRASRASYHPPELVKQGPTYSLPFPITLPSNTTFFSTFLSKLHAPESTHRSSTPITLRSYQIGAPFLGLKRYRVRC